MLQQCEWNLFSKHHSLGILLKRKKPGCEWKHFLEKMGRQDTWWIMFEEKKKYKGSGKRGLTIQANENSILKSKLNQYIIRIRWVRHLKTIRSEMSKTNKRTQNKFRDQDGKSLNFYLIQDIF